MDLVLVMSELKPGQNVSPDMSSYDAMVTNWRGVGIIPTLQEVETKWAEIEPAYLQKKAEETLRKKFLDAGMDNFTILQALWEKIMNNNSIDADAIKTTVDDLKK